MAADKLPSAAAEATAVARNRKFESISLQGGVSDEPKGLVRLRSQRNLLPPGRQRDEERDPPGE
jgi:hypothetical protein